MNEKPSASSPESGNPPIRVLVVDDSAFMRFTITRHLSETAGIQVIGSARDGKEALQLIPELKPDVVTLDVEMPHLDGLSTLREIMAEFPVPVIMVSSLTKEGAVETIQALTYGAVDFVAKPSNKASVSAIVEELVTKIQRASRARVTRMQRRAITLPQQMASPAASNKSVRTLRRGEPLVLIGSSTGGPRALNTLIPMLAADTPAAFVIVQHMPAGFTRSLAERLDSLSGLSVKEAEPGDIPEVGKVLLAPGGFHMVFDQNMQVTLNQNPTVHGVRPSVDVTMNSLVQHCPAPLLGVILTGMGSDGTTGCTLIHSRGGKILVEDESTCVVWGMPRSVMEAGVADQIVPLDQMAQAITNTIRKF